MNRILHILLIVSAVFVALPGCGGSGDGSSNVAEDADQAAIDEYKAAIEAEEQQANEAMAQ